MKVKKKIRQDVSQAFNVLIPKGKWLQYMEMLDKDGHPNRRELIALILIFSQHLEELENMVEDLYFQIELSEGKNPSPLPKEEFRLRTPENIAQDLEKLLTPETTRFYLSEDDWKIMEQNINQELAKTNPEYGYGKEVDPRDYIQKVCMYYKGLPVFRK